MNLSRDDYKITAIIPVYNIKDFLPRCIESVLSQTHKNLEIILIDDGATDGSGDICDDYAKKDGRVKVFHKQNGGVSSARNVGLKNATGDYIIFPDGDDFISPDFCSVLLDAAMESLADIAVCKFVHYKDGDSLVKDNANPRLKLFGKTEMVSALLKNTPFDGSCWGKLFSYRICKGIFFDEKISHYEDYDYLYRVMKNADKLVFVDKVMYYYYDRDGSAARLSFNEKKVAILDVIDRICFDISENYDKIKKVVDVSRIRTYLMVADFIKASGYNDKALKLRVKKFVRKKLLRFLFSDVAVGYKIKALKLSLGWRLY